MLVRGRRASNPTIGAGGMSVAELHRMGDIFRSAWRGLDGRPVIRRRERPVESPAPREPGPEREPVAGDQAADDEPAAP